MYEKKINRTYYNIHYTAAATCKIQEPLLLKLINLCSLQFSNLHPSHLNMATSKLFDIFVSEWPEVEEKAIKLLQELIQTDTQNDGENGTETDAVEVIKKRFDASGVKYKTVEPKPGRGNIIARLEGDGSSGKGALCLSAHLDTVKAPTENWEEAGWKHNPFGGEIDEDDGCLYGRGAIDMKQMAAMCVTLVCFMKEKGIRLTRDLIFAGIADEERSDSKYGVKYLIENEPDLIEADIVFTEVGGMSFHSEGREVFPIMFGEKGSAKIKITAFGPGGHSSTYHKDNPIALIGSVAQTLATKRLPLRVVPGGRTTIESMSSLVPGLKGFVFRKILSPRFSDYIVDYLLDESQIQALVPLLHNTASPTIISGGENPNQIPTEASVIVDGRILPGCTIDDLLYDIRQVIGPNLFQTRENPQGEELSPLLKMEVLHYRYPYEQDPTSPAISEVIEILRQVIYDSADGAPIITNIIMGGTDLKFYAEHPTKKPICLGFEPFRLPPGINLVSLFHSVNERIPVDGYKWGLRVLADVVSIICDASIQE